MQQLSGINAVVSYSGSMLGTAGISDSLKQYCVVAIGVFNVVCTVISLPLIERMGRRTLILWPTVVLALSLFFLTITVNLATSASMSEGVRLAMSILSVILILIYTVGFALGLGPVPALIVAEIFRQGPRGAAYSISQALQWFSNLVVMLSYPKLDKWIGGYSFLPFLVVVSACWVFFFMFMPETRNRTFDEIARDLAFGNVVIHKHEATFTPEAELEAGVIKGGGGGDEATEATRPLMSAETVA
jgi:SP family facilitated glucose transporter-like MFS transporter 1